MFCQQSGGGYSAVYFGAFLPAQVGLVGPDGRDLPLHLKPSSSSKQKSSHKSSSNSRHVTTPEGTVHNTGLQGSISTSLVLLVDSWSQSFTFTRLPDKPYVSLLRDFSAPVRLDVEGETDKSLGFLATHDSNAFARCALVHPVVLAMLQGNSCPAAAGCVSSAEVIYSGACVPLQLASAAAHCVLMVQLLCMHSLRWDAMQRLMGRLLTRLYDRAEGHADSIQDMDSLAAVLAEAGGMPPALLSALQAALAANDLDGEYQVR